MLDINDLYIDGLWDRLYDEIYKQNKTKVQVAKVCGFDRKRLNGQKNIPLLYFARLCAVLHVSADYLLFGEQNIFDEQEHNKKELMELAEDFELLHREDVHEIIENCQNYEEGHRKIMDIYNKVYMN